jgi:DNA polymerase-4
MKIGCILIPHLPLQMELRGEPTLAERPLVIGGRPWDDGAVLDCCPRAAEHGVRPGMRLFRAEALSPSACFIPAREAAYRALCDRLLAAAGRFSPTVETAGLGQAYIDASGLERQFGPDQVLARQIAREASHSTGLAAGVGMAGNKFAAEQAAWAAPPGEGVAIPPNEERSFLSPLSLDVLPAVDPEIFRRLRMLGVLTLGDLARLPRPAVVRQFGVHAGPIHDLASGRDPRPLQPDAPPLAIERRQLFDEPLRGLAPLTAHIQRLAEGMAEGLARDGYQAEGLRLRVELEDRSVEEAAGAVKPPSAAADKLARLAGQLLERVGPNAPVAGLLLITYPLRPTHLGAVQLSLLDQKRDGRHERLREVLRSLRVRFGELAIMVASLVKPPPPYEVQITAGPDGTPRAVVWRERIRPVKTLYESWRERRRWWGRAVERDYYRLELNDGQVRVLYQELRSGQWLLERRRL